MNRNTFIAVCVLTVAPVLAEAPTFPFGQPDEEYRVPTRFILIDLLDMGVIVPTRDWPGSSMRAATFTCILGPARFGVGAAETYYSMDEWDFWVVLPAHVGVTLWSDPKPTWRFWGAAPDIYVNVSASLWQNTSGSWDSWPWPPQPEHDPFVNVALCYDADYYGIGVSARLGAYRDRWGRGETSGAVYFELQLRAGSFRIAF